MRKLFITIFLVQLLISFVFSQDKATSPCSSAEAKQFDFWVGKWHLTWQDKNGKTKTGTNIITKILDGCVIEENFIGGTFNGKSVSVYNPVKKIWQQTWVDNSGGYMVFTGTFKNDQMILSHEVTTKENKKILLRMIFYNISEDKLDWNWERSTDNGKTWHLLWKIHYKRNN